MGFFDKWLLSDGDRTILEAKKIKDTVDAEQEHEQKVAEMTSKRCPIQDGDCFVGCVHFNPGEVRMTQHYDELRWVDVGTYPRCRLWR